MKICSSCKFSKHIEEFGRKGGTGTQSKCLKCQRKYAKEHYQANKEYYNNKARAFDEKYFVQVRTYLWDYLSSHPCECGESNPIVLEFDHNDNTSKINGIGGMVRDRKSLTSIIEEIDKCTVRCCNCHRKRTASQFNWWNNAFVA